MLRAQELSKTLRKVCEDGKEEGLLNILMMDDDGAILGAANPTDTSEEHCSAVLASIYNEYRAAEKCISTEGCLRTVLFNTENGKVAVRELFDDDGEQRYCEAAAVAAAHCVGWRIMANLRFFPKSAEKG
eukprot:g6902.t1